jgi:hypothetical protein
MRSTSIAVAALSAFVLLTASTASFAQANSNSTLPKAPANANSGNTADEEGRNPLEHSGRVSPTGKGPAARDEERTTGSGTTDRSNNPNGANGQGGSMDKGK